MWTHKTTVNETMDTYNNIELGKNLSSILLFLNMDTDIFIAMLKQILRFITFTIIFKCDKLVRNILQGGIPWLIRILHCSRTFMSLP